MDPVPNSRSGALRRLRALCPAVPEACPPGLPPAVRSRILPVLSAGRALTCLTAENERPLLVLCRSRARAEQAARLLSERLSAPVPFYHHGLDTEEKARLRAHYLRRKSAALVATPGCGRELLRPDLRTLIFARPPPTAEAYLREARWAGRDGRAAACILLQGPGIGAPGRGQSDEEPAGWREIVAAVAANDRILSERELCELLAGRGGLATVRKKLYMYTGYGYLYRWQSEDIVEAVSALLRAGVLRVPERGAWRRRVILVHREARWKIHFRNYSGSRKTARAV